MRILLSILSTSILLSPVLMAEKPKSKIEKVMSPIGKPYKKLKKLAKAKQYTSSKFRKSGKELIKASKAFADFEHKETKFIEFNKKYAKNIKSFAKSLKSKKRSKIEKSFLKVKASCTECHDEYKKKD